MPQTETFVVTIPVDLAQKIRARVSPAGEFKTENDVILHHLVEAEAWNLPPKDELGSVEAWEKEALETLARLDRGEEPTYTIDEVRAHISQWRSESEGQ